MAEGARPRRPAPAGHELALARVRTRVHVEVLLAHAPHFFEPGQVGAARLGRRRAGELRLEQRPERPRAVPAVADRRRDAVVGEAAFPLFADEPAVPEQAEVARDARLGDAEDARQLRDVQPVEGQEPQEPEPRVVAEQPVERRGVLHIY